jgi:hypothetical protein
MYGHVLQKPVSDAAKPFGLELLLSRQFFSAQGGPRQKLKICSEPPGNEHSEYVFKNSLRWL